jgi:uncharacterized protein (TIGR03435 family)
MKHIAVAAMAALVVATISTAVARAQAPLEFEVASIKPMGERRTGVAAPTNPSLGQWALSGVTARDLVLRAYPIALRPAKVVGAPSWATTDWYAVIVKGKPGTTPEEQQRMWQALLADRMKLRAHYEVRPQPVYELVMAHDDRRLGPQLEPSTLDCEPKTPEARLEEARALSAQISRENDSPSAALIQQIMSRCDGIANASGTLYAGGMNIKGLIAMGFMMQGGALDRPVVDRTGLEGRYAFTLTFARPSLAGPADDRPSLFTALQQQLGLKLEPTVIEAPVLVIDHIERPTEN